MMPDERRHEYPKVFVRLTVRDPSIAKVPPQDWIVQHKQKPSKAKNPSPPKPA